MTHEFPLLMYLSGNCAKIDIITKIAKNPNTNKLKLKVEISYPAHFLRWL